MGAQTAEAPQRVRYVRDVQGFTEAGGRRIAAGDYYFYPGWGIRYELYDNNALLFERLTPGSHAAYPSLSPDGSRIAYIERDDQERRLLVRSADFDDEPALLFRVPYNGILQFTSISPDGKKIVFLARNGERGGGDITVCNLEGPAECQSVVTGPGVKSAPVFSRDGKTVIFSSDVDGVFNLYSAGLDSHEVKRLTRTLTGLFFPAPGPDYLYSIGYYSNGYDVVRMKYGDLLAENVDYFRKQEEEQVEPESTPQNWTHEEYSGVFDIKPWFTGLVNIFGAAGPSVFDVGFAARDPLDRHYFAAAIGTGSPDPVAALYYDYSRYNLGFTADYTTNSWKKHSPSGCINDDDPLRFLCDSKYSFRQEAYAALRYTSQNRYVNFQILPGYMVQELRNARVIRTTEYDARDLNLIGPALTILAGQAEYYPTSISAEHGWNFFVDGQYYTKDRSRKELDGAYSHAIEYGKVEGGLSLYLPSFFDHHVNYLNAYGYTVFGPDREIQKVSLNRFVRGLDYGKAPSDHSAFVGTYEYRLPILWYSKEITKDSSAIMLRSIGMSVFFDYGQSFDRQLYRDRWNGSYGASVFVGLNIANLHLADFKITIARGMGPAGELQAYLSLYSGFDDGIITDYDSNKSPILSPYHRSMPGRQDMPGYFREQMAGGVLQ